MVPKTAKTSFFTASVTICICLIFTRKAEVSSFTLCNTNQRRSHFMFLSSSAAAFMSSVASETPDKCDALEEATSQLKTKPRYLEYEIEMKVPDGPGGNPRTRGFFVKRFTGDSTPFQFPVKPIRLVKEWPEEAPFAPEDFSREDPTNDRSFYTIPRLLYHIDEPAVASLTQYYRNNIQPGSAVLDICSSWVSHYPMEFPETMSRISGTGMSKLELKANDQLTDFEEKDLNMDPTLPYEDGTFDVVSCVVSIDYLIHPMEVLKEVNRVLKPGGKAIISQSNRCFPTKAISMWLQMNDRQHLELINGYFQYAGGFEPRTAFDITASGAGICDPMFIVEGVKSA